MPTAADRKYAAKILRELADNIELKTPPKYGLGWLELAEQFIYFDKTSHLQKRLKKKETSNADGPQTQ